MVNRNKIFIILFVLFVVPACVFSGEFLINPHSVSSGGGGGGTITYAYGDGTYSSTATNGLLLIPYASSGNPAYPSASVTIDTIKVYKATSATGAIRIWKGTISGTTFTFDSYTEVVDYAADTSTGWLTLEAPTDFSAFTMSTSNVLAFYCYNNSNGIAYGRATGVSNMAAAYSPDDPPYSANASLAETTAYRFEVYAEGDAN